MTNPHSPFEPDPTTPQEPTEPDPTAGEPTEPDPTAGEPTTGEPTEPEPTTGEPTEPDVTTNVFDLIDPGISDEEILAAAGASLHDEPDMVNPQTGADPGNPNDGSDTDPGAGATPPGATPPFAPGPQPYYPAPPGVRRLYRSRDDRRLGGVSAGIAEYFRIDPTLVRLATLLAAFTGVAVFVYLAAWIIIPLRPEGYQYAPDPKPAANERTMTLAFGVAALALAIGIVTGSWSVLAIALIGGGVWLLSEHTVVTPSAIGSPSASGLSSYQAPTGFEPAYIPPRQSAGPVPPGIGATPPAPVPPRIPRERTPQHITWTVLSLLALLAGVGVAATTGNWWDVSATRFLGIAVVIIGIGVVAGQFRNGGARGLIPLGILAAALLLPVSAVDGLLDDGVGEATYRPTSFAEFEPSYEHGVGTMRVDLSELDFDGRSETVDIELGIGELIVIVSDQTGGEAVLEATAGEISHMLPNTNAIAFNEGVNIESGTIMLEGDTGTLSLNIDVGLGTAELRSEAN